MELKLKRRASSDLLISKLQ